MTRYSRGQRKSRHTFLLAIPKLGTRTGDMYERVCGPADSIHTAIILLLAAPRAINPRGNFLHFPEHPAYVRRIPSVAPELRDFRKRSRAQGIIFSGRRSSVFQSPRRDRENSRDAHPQTAFRRSPLDFSRKWRMSARATSIISIS